MIGIPLEKDELIGKVVQVVSCTDPTMKDLKGVIIDETQQMFLVESSGKRKWIAKQIATFVFPTANNYEIKGSSLRFRPEERVKKAR